MLKAHILSRIETMNTIKLLIMIDLGYVGT